MTRSTIFFAALLAAGVACSKKSETGGAAGESGATGAATGEPSGAKAAGDPAPAPDPLDEAEVRALVDAWLAAQNGGDFDAYGALYAERMTGVKRVGPRVSDFDRKGWLADRERMFQRKMEVVAADVEIATTASAAIVRFEQTWSSGKFKDQGPKQLVVVREGDRLRIAREEMLRSTVVSGGRRATAPTREQFGFAISADSRTYLILSGNADEAWTTGQSELLPGPAPFMARRAVDPARLPAELRAWQGREVTMVSIDGECTAKLGDLVALAGATPHFGTVQQWDGDFDGSARVSTPAERAEEIWRMVDRDSRVLAAEVPGGCKGSFGRSEPVDAMQRLEVAVLTPAQEGAALAAFRKLAGYAAAQSAYDAERPGAGSWEEDAEAERAVIGFFDRKRNRLFVAIRLQTGAGCGDFHGEVSAVIELDGNDRVTSTSELEPSFAAEMAFDVQGDGAIEILGAGFFGTTLLVSQSTAAGFEVVEALSWPYYDCPC